MYILVLTALCVFQISELLTDVERLKQALNGLSQLAYAGNAAPNKRQMQHIDTLQAQIKSLQQQLAVSVCIHTHTHTADVVDGSQL